MGLQIFRIILACILLPFFGITQNVLQKTACNPLPFNIFPQAIVQCSNQTPFTVSVTGAATCTWSTSQTTFTILISPTITTTYSVFGYDINGCPNSATMTAVINTPSVSIMSNVPLLCVGASATLTGIGNFFWWQNGTVISPSVTTTYTAEGVDVIGCWLTASYTQSVVNCTAIDKDEITKSPITIVPNPNNGEFKFSRSFSDESPTLMIFNTMGQIVFEQGLNELNEIVATHLPAGIYSYRIVGNKVITGVILVD